MNGMMLIDFSQLVYSALHSYAATNKGMEDKDVIYVIINCLYNMNKKFKNEYGEMVVCFDSKNYWRREFFPYYKSGRKAARESSKLNWDLVFKVLNYFKEDLKENFHYKFLEIDGAESDDIIAVLTKKYHIHKNILIISGDKDFLQLHRYPNVRQYSPIAGTFLKSQNPFRDLKEKIIRGESAGGDAIPSILSEDNVFIIGKRQSPLTESKFNFFIENDPEKYEADVYTRFLRNQTLIDFDYIKEDIIKNIINEYDNYVVKGNKSKIYKYLAKKQFVELLEIIPEL